MPRRGLAHELQLSGEQLTALAAPVINLREYLRRWPKLRAAERAHLLPGDPRRRLRAGEVRERLPQLACALAPFVERPESMHADRRTSLKAMPDGPHLRLQIGDVRGVGLSRLARTARVYRPSSFCRHPSSRAREYDVDGSLSLLSAIATLRSVVHEAQGLRDRRLALPQRERAGDLARDLRLAVEIERRGARERDRQRSVDGERAAREARDLKRGLVRLEAREREPGGAAHRQREVIDAARQRELRCAVDRDRELLVRELGDVDVADARHRDRIERRHRDRGLARRHLCRAVALGSVDVQRALLVDGRLELVERVARAGYGDLRRRSDRDVDIRRRIDRARVKRRDGAGLREHDEQRERGHREESRERRERLTSAVRAVVRGAAELAQQVARGGQTPGITLDTRQA